MDAASIQKILDAENDISYIISPKILPLFLPLMEELGKNQQWHRFMEICMNYLVTARDNIQAYQRIPEPVLEILAKYSTENISEDLMLNHTYFTVIYNSLLAYKQYNPLTIKLIDAWYLGNELRGKEMMASAMAANNVTIIQYLQQRYRISPIYQSLRTILPRNFVDTVNEETMAYLLDYNKTDDRFLTVIASSNSDLGVLRLVMPYVDVNKVYSNIYDDAKLEFLLKYNIKNQVKDFVEVKLKFLKKYFGSYSDDLKVFLIYLFDPNGEDITQRLNLSVDGKEKAKTIRKFTSSLSEISDKIDNCLKLKEFEAIVDCVYQSKSKELEEAARKEIGEGKNLIGEIQIKDNYQDQQGNLLKQVGVTTETLALLRQKDSARIQLFLNSIKKVYPATLVAIGETENGGRVWVGLAGEYIFNVTMGIYLIRLRVKAGSVLILAKYDNIELETVEEGEMLVFGE